MTEKQNTNNVSIQSSFTVQNLIDDMKKCLGFIVSAESGSGKSYLGFTICREAMKAENKTRIIIFSPSTIYNRKFGSCDNLKLIKVGTADFSPVVDYDKEMLERVANVRDTFFLNTDKKYMFKRSLWLEQLLANDSLNLCFEIHYLNSRKAKTFITECLKLIFERERKKLERNPDYDFHTLAVLEECQNSYGTYNLNDDSSLEALGILSMARTDCNLHFLAITQRLAETSVKVTERLRLISGLQIGYNNLNRVRAQITPELRELVQRLPQKTFLYINGKDNPIFQIPQYSFKGKMTQIRPMTQPTEQPKKKDGFIKQMKQLLKAMFSVPQQYQPQTQQNNNEEQNNDDIEQSQADGLMTDDSDIMFPEDEY
ncbi:MAG: hypothetical protein ABSC20_06330 [Candidatus Bathyarchaeia archaeon]|jgi:hypothetical protein